jgi:HEPN domain-containing protein
MRSNRKVKSSTSGAEAWLSFARDDARAARKLVSEQLWNLVCFHAQQASEKALKGFLRHHQDDVPRVHSLAKLIELCSHVDRTFLRQKSTALFLDRYYIPTRYPEAPPGSLAEGLPDKADAQLAIQKMGKILRLVASRLKLPRKTQLGF